MTAIKRMEEYTVHGFKQVVNVIFLCVCLCIQNTFTKMESALVTPVKSNFKKRQ